MTYDGFDSFQSGLQLNFFAILIAMIKPRISASKAYLMLRYFPNQPLEKPRQILKIPSVTPAPGLSFYGTSSIELDKRHCIIDSSIINLISRLVIRTHSHYCIIQFTIGIFVFEFLVVIRFEFDSLKYKIAL